MLPLVSSLGFWNIFLLICFIRYKMNTSMSCGARAFVIGMTLIMQVLQEIDMSLCQELLFCKKVLCFLELRSTVCPWAPNSAVLVSHWGINYSSPLSHCVFPALWAPCCVIPLLQVCCKHEITEGYHWFWTPCLRDRTWEKMSCLISAAQIEHWVNPSS